MEQLAGSVLVARAEQHATRAGAAAGDAGDAARSAGVVPLGRPAPAHRASGGARRARGRAGGFAWGDVLEWVAGGARPFLAARGAGRRERWTSSSLPKAKEGTGTAGAACGVLRAATSATPALAAREGAPLALPHDDRSRSGFAPHCARW
ncbi:MAG: hypothetical protein U1F67_25640 [Rubrivivax sp.]